MSFRNGPKAVARHEQSLPFVAAAMDAEEPENHFESESGAAHKVPVQDQAEKPAAQRMRKELGEK